MIDRLRWLAASLVHLYTASGAVLGLVALNAAVGGDVRAAFLWLAACTFIDATDGWLARRARVSQVVPQIDGALLDNIVDYLTYVFVPVVVMLRTHVLSPGLEWVAASAVLLASGFGFSRTDAKTHDHFFTGFPSYWNIVAFYLFAAGLPPWANTGIVLGLVALVFVPVGYVYPSRTVAMRTATITIGSAWAIAVLVSIWQLPRITTWLVWVSLLFPAYYMGLSAVLHARRSPSS